MKTSIDDTKGQQNLTPSRKNTTQSTAGTASFVDNRPGAIQLKKLRQGITGNAGLPDNLKTGIESLSGYSMDDVKVNYNSSKPAQLQAHAYAQGTEIHLGPGQEKHLPHEAWHVVQQKQGRVKPTRQLKSKVNINDDAGLENEADVMGSKAMNHQNSGTRFEPVKKGGSLEKPVVQAVRYDWMMPGNKEEDEVALPFDRAEWYKEQDRHQTALPYAKIYIPKAGIPTHVTYIAHGSYSKLDGGEESTFDPINNIDLNYIGPHGYDAQSTLTEAWQESPKGRGVLYEFSPGTRRSAGNEFKWYNYTLSKEVFHLDPRMQPVLQEIADNHQVTVLVMKGNVRTSDLVPSLVRLGYTKISAVHCRGTHGDNSKEWLPGSYDGLDEKASKKQEDIDKTADTLGDPGPKKEPKPVNHRISRAYLSNPKYFHDLMGSPVNGTNLSAGLIIRDVRRKCFFRVSGFTATTVFLRGLTSAEYNLLSYSEEELDDVNGLEELGLTLAQGQKAKAIHQRHNRWDEQEDGKWESAGYLPY